MKAHKECVAEFRRLFVEAHPAMVRRIEREADEEAAALGLDRETFIQEQINIEFTYYVNQLEGDSTATIITLLVEHGPTRKNLLRGYYKEVAESIGMNVEDFLKENRITL